MKKLTWINNLRLGIIFSVTGIVIIAVSLLRPIHRVSVPVAITIGVLLLIISVPFIMQVLQHKKSKQ